MSYFNEDKYNDVDIANIEEAAINGNEIDLTAPVNPDKNECTVCTLDTSDNLWFLPRAPGYPGRCVLDELTYDDVYQVLLRNPNAAADLARITDDCKLLALSREVKVEQDPLEDDKRFADNINRNTLPYYTQFAGNVGGDIIGKRGKVTP